MTIFKKTTVRAGIMALFITAAGGFLSLAALAESPSGTSSNLPPIAENLEFSTFRDVPINEPFSAADPEGDAVTFEIVTHPRRGTVSTFGDGTFIYTPRERFRGRDSFGYVAVDAYGNVSAEATVRINVKRQSGRTNYVDMDDHRAAFAALVLAENRVFTGETLGDRQFFRPDKTVSRGEFLSMALKTAGVEPLSGVTRTGFYDDDSIPLWIKPYVSTALMNGVITGYRNPNGRIVFSPDSPITFSEAAVILNNLLDITDVAIPTAASVDPYIPAWAYTASRNLSATRIIAGGISGIHSDHVTRADAAVMLLNSRNLLEGRDDGAPLLGWAR